MIKEKVKLPGEAYSSRVRARFWITGDEEGYVGIGRIELLENIDRLGSINQAALEMGMSYKKAWRLIQDLNKMYKVPLVIKEKGGVAGGGTQLTDKGRALIAAFRQLEQELAVFLEEKVGELRV